MTRPFTAMTFNSNGLWVRCPPRNGKPGTWRHKHLLATMSRNNCSLVGLQEHHVQAAGTAEKIQTILPSRWRNLAKPSMTERSGVALLWREDVWKLVEEVTGIPDERVLAAVLRDEDGRNWLMIVAHFRNAPREQRQTWAAMEAIQQQKPDIPVIVMADHNATMDPFMDDLEAFEGRKGEESQNVQSARDKARLACVRMQMLDAWRVIFPDPEERVEMGLTRQNRRIDRITVSATLAPAIGGAYTTPIGGSDHRAVLVRLVPRATKGPPNIWRMGSALLSSEGFEDRFEKAMKAIEDLPVWEWWAAVPEVLQRLEMEMPRRRGWDSEVLAMQRALSRSTTTSLAPSACRFLGSRGQDLEPEQGYRRLASMIEASKEKIQQEEVLNMLREELFQAGDRDSRAVRSSRTKHINRLLRQLQERRQMAAVRTADGKLLTAEDEVAQELCRYWGGVMTPVSPPSEAKCQDYLRNMPRRWNAIVGQLWAPPTMSQAEEALRRLDPSSAPGDDGVPASVYRKFPSIFAPRMLQAVETAIREGGMPPSWIKGMTRCVPKTVGAMRADQQCPITLLNSRTKWLTGILKIGLEGVLQTVVPPEQRGFMTGRSMEDHLLEVTRRWRSGAKGVWVSIDFAKAFDSTSHELMAEFLRLLGIPEAVERLILSFLKGPLRFLVGNRLSEQELTPKSGIKQGDVLSPALFSLLTAVLVEKLRAQDPGLRAFLYADDTLIWVPGTPAEVEPKVRELLGLLVEYGEVSGYRLNRTKCAIVPQGWDEEDWPKEVAGLSVAKKTRYLGVWLGQVGEEEQYQGPLAKAMTKASFLARLPLSTAEKVKVLETWLYPVLGHVAAVIRPPSRVLSRAGQIMRMALGIKSWTLPTLHMTQPEDRGGYKLQRVTDYLHWAHSRTYVNFLRGRDSPVMSRLKQELDEWTNRKGQPYTLQAVDRRTFSWYRVPREGWPTLASSAASYAEFKVPMPSEKLQAEDILSIPLWNSTHFTNSKGRTYYCPPLARRGKWRLRDILDADGSRIIRLWKYIPKTWQEVYTTRTQELKDLAAKGGAQNTGGAEAPGLTDWRMGELSAKLSDVHRPSQRQQEKDWQLLQRRRIPWRLLDFIIRAWWRKLPVATRLAEFKMIPTGTCVLCGGLEDHAHILKKCAALDPMKEIIRSRWRPLVLKDNTWVEPSRICKEHVGLSVTTVQGLLMWTSILARWLVRCDMLNGREEEHEHRVLRRTHAVLSTWGTVPDPLLGMDHVREAQRIIVSHMKRSPLRIPSGWDPGVSRATGPATTKGRTEQAIEVLTLAIRIEGREGFVAATEMPGAEEPWQFCSQGEAGAGEQEAEVMAAMAAMDRVPPDVPMAISTPHMSLAVALMTRTTGEQIRIPGLPQLMERVAARDARTEWRRVGYAAEAEARRRGARAAAAWLHHTFPPPTPPRIQPIELDPETPIGVGLDFEEDLPGGDTPSTVGTAEPGAEQDFDGVIETVEVSSATDTGSESGQRCRKKPRRLSWAGLEDPEPE